MHPGSLVRLTFGGRPNHVGDSLFGALALVRDHYLVYGIEAISIVVTTGPRYGDIFSVACNDVEFLSGPKES